MKTILSASSVLLLAAGLAAAANLPTSLELNAAELASTEQAAPADPATAPKVPSLFGGESLFGDKEIFWKGFLTGSRGFDQIHNPIGSPLYFESPIIDTELRPLFIHHVFPKSSQVQGGQVNVFAAQARVAITDRIAFIATKDGYSFLSTGALGEGEGFNDLAAGLKFAFWVDEKNEFIASGGVRYQFANGSSAALQRADQEWSPFISIAKGFGDFHTVAGVSYRLPEHADQGNQVLMWDLNASWDIAKDILPGFAPVAELHGIHYMTDGKRVPFSVGGVDYTNLGSADVEGRSTITAGLGARWRLTPNISLGGLFELPLTTPGNDITLNRLTFDVIFKY